MFSSEPKQRENHKSSAAPNPPYHQREGKLALETQRQRLQLRMDGEQFWSTPTVPPAIPPRQNGPQCTGGSRCVREDFHTLPQSVLVTTAWNNTVPNFDLALGTTTGTLQSTNSNERLFGSKSSARQLTTRISHQMFGELFTRANSAHVEQPYPRIPRHHYREKDDHPKVSPNDNQFMGTCDKNARPTTVQLFARDRRAMLARCSISPRSAWPTMTRTKRKCFI